MKEHPTPWTFEWDPVPKVYDADGRTVAVVSAGTIAGAYDTSDISETGGMIAAAPETKAQRDELLAACEIAEEVLEDRMDNASDPDAMDKWTNRCETAAAGLRAVIAIAKGKS